jgi:catechol 2,3-dioxygenase-like lactoylglutathione lyase family enzyme
VTDGYQPFFHVGILVRDIEAAAADFGARLGVRFEPVRSGSVVSGETCRFAYSVQGPPYIELVEMTGTGTWDPAQGEGLHHIGFADPDVPGRCAIFDGAADPVIQGDGGLLRVIFTRPSALHGVRCEYLESAGVDLTHQRLRSLSS